MSYEITNGRLIMSYFIDSINKGAFKIDNQLRCQLNKQDYHFIFFYHTTRTNTSLKDFCCNIKWNTWFFA